jgi:hypothetical protein
MAVGAIKFIYESAGKPGSCEIALNEVALTIKKKIGMKSEEIKAKIGRQICLVFRIER